MTQKRFSLEKLTQSTTFLSVIALILSLLVSGAVMLIAGYSPIEGYGAMFTGAFGSVDNLAQTLGTATPLIFAGLAMAFAARGGMFNIGIEGQIIAGAFPAALVGAYLAANPGQALEAALAAVCAMGVCGERAHARLRPGEGNASYRNHLIDAVYALTAQELDREARYAVYG